MKNKIIESACILLFIFNFTTYSLGQKNNKISNIPFDSITQKYTYIKITNIPNKNEKQLYKTAKEWTKKKFSEEKYLIDNENIQLTDLGSFSFVYHYKQFPIPYTIIYNLNFLFKNEKYKLEITNIRLSQNSQGTTAEYTLEAFKQYNESFKIGKKTIDKMVYEIMSEIDLTLLKVISEIESAMINESKNDTEW